MPFILLYQMSQNYLMGLDWRFSPNIDLENLSSDARKGLAVHFS
jgi:hypothetical protein